MLKQLVKVGLLTAVLLIPATSWSQPGPPPRPGGRNCMEGRGGGPGPHGPGMGISRWWEHPEVQKKLDLSPEQVEKIGSQRLETETKMIEVGSKKRIAQLRLRDLVSKKDASEEEINKYIEEIGDLQKEQMKAVIGQTRSVRTILNEEQQSKVDRFLKNRHERANRGPLFKGGPGAWDDQPRDKDGKGDRGPGKGNKDDRGGRRGKDRGDGDGPHPFGRGFGMAPDGQGDLPGIACPGAPDAPPPSGPEFGGPAGPPEGPGASEEALGDKQDCAPFPPESGPEVGWAEGDLEPDLLMGDFPNFDEPLEDILADFE